MANPTDPILVTNTKKIIPETTVTNVGTIDCVNNKAMIVGTGTIFALEAHVGDYVYVAAENEFRRIQSIQDDLSLYLSEPFSNTFATASYELIRERYIVTSWLNDSVGPCRINNIVFPADASASLELRRNERSANRHYTPPVIIDTTDSGNTVTVIVQ